MIRIKGALIFDSEHLSKDLGRKAIRGGGVTLLSQGLLVGFNLLQTIILARLLTPEDFGLIGMVTVFVSFGVMFKDAGLSLATVQRAHITEAQISSLFWCNVFLSTGLGGVICLTAPFVSLFYEKPELTAITLSLSGSFVVSGLQIQHLALLQRNMMFAAISIINIGSCFVAFVVAVLMAFNGAGYWALIGASWGQALTAVVLTFFFCSWRPKRFQRNVGMGSMLTFGSHLTGLNLLNFFSRNLDYILIGRFLGAEPLGVYQRAYALMMRPLQSLNGPLSSVGTPTLSRLQEDPEKYRHYFVNAVNLLLFVTMPLAAYFIVMSREIVMVLLGNQWENAITPFMLLSFCLLRQPLGGACAWLFISQGRTRQMMTNGIVLSLITISSICIGINWGVVGVAGCYALASVASLPLLLWYAGDNVFVTVRLLWKLYIKRLYAFLGAMILIGVLRTLLLHLGIDIIWVLFATGALFAVYLLALFLLDQDFRYARYFLLKRMGKALDRSQKHKNA